MTSAISNKNIYKNNLLYLQYMYRVEVMAILVIIWSKYQAYLAMVFVVYTLLFFVLISLV